jgi:hypothetical protein
VPSRAMGLSIAQALTKGKDVFRGPWDIPLRRTSLALRRGPAVPYLGGQEHTPGPGGLHNSGHGPEGFKSPWPSDPTSEVLGPWARD